jgi:hypothetical protein
MTSYPDHLSLLARLCYQISDLVEIVSEVALFCPLSPHFHVCLNHSLRCLMMGLSFLLIFDLYLLDKVFLFSIELLIHSQVSFLFYFDYMFHDITDLLGFLDVASFALDLFL